MWIWGSPFSGKTFLAAELELRGYPVWETDSEISNVSGWSEDLRTAWLTDDSPDLEKWNKIQAEHLANARKAADEGQIVFHHNPPPSEEYVSLRIHPSETDLAQRIIEDIDERGAEAAPRLIALFRHLEAYPAENGLTTDEVRERIYEELGCIGQPEQKE